MVSIIGNSKKGEGESLTVVPGAEATSDDNGQLGDVRTCDCADHFRAVLGNATFLCFGTDHIPSDVYKEKQRDLALRAQLDKVRRLECRRREKDAIVRDDTHGKTVDVCESLRIAQSKVVSGYPGPSKKEHATVTMVCPYSFLNSRKRLPSTTRAITSRISNG